VGVTRHQRTAWAMRGKMRSPGWPPSGTTLVVCASSDGSFAGRAYVFTKTATGWRQSAELSGSPTGSFGESVAISGITIVVGGADITDTGQAYVFRNTAKGWRQTAVLTDYQPAPADGFGE
jgi:hypothetical protein